MRVTPRTEARPASGRCTRIDCSPCTVRSQSRPSGRSRIQNPGSASTLAKVGATFRRVSSTNGRASPSSGSSPAPMPSAYSTHWRQSYCCSTAGISAASSRSGSTAMAALTGSRPCRGSRWPGSTARRRWHAPSTWRSPHSPRSCATDSMTVNSPYMPGWLHDRPPPLVLTGRLPPGAIAPLSTNAPASPLAQKPRSSRNSSVLMVKASYSITWSMSRGATPAISHARRPDSTAQVTVRSGMAEICRWLTATPVPRRSPGSCRPWSTDR
ncbi:Uncharacterised protein [Bordetella pertussis]|nr:Uncharacterised protein [Bordetella pertussis]